jgi:hypothetical protein
MAPGYYGKHGRIMFACRGVHFLFDRSCLLGGLEGSGEVLPRELDIGKVGARRHPGTCARSRHDSGLIPRRGSAGGPGSGVPARRDGFHEHLPEHKFQAGTDMGLCFHDSLLWSLQRTIGQ